MSKPTENQLIASLAAVMTVAEGLAEVVAVQLKIIADLYEEMPDDIKKKIAKAQIEAKLGRKL